MPHYSRILFLVLLLALTNQVVKSQQPQQAPNSGAATKPTNASFRLVRSVSGTKSLQQGSSYVIEDPRSLFYLPEDKQILVHFTWEGPIGSHNFEGWWKNPEGKVVVTSNFSFPSDQPRFGSYFSMTTNDNFATGIWSLEVRIDGEPAGAHSFQIVSGSRPAGLITRRILTRPEVYQRISAATVSVENLNRLDERQKLASGFFIAKDQLLTSFEVIDSASRVRVTLPDGNRVDANTVLAFDRKKDWAILKLDGLNTLPLPRSTDEASIGDRIFSINVPTEANRVLQETTIVGKQNTQFGGERLIVADSVGRRAIGAPVLNEYGEVLGVISAGVIPGSAFLEGAVYPSTLSGMGNSLSGALAIPITLVAQPVEESPGLTIQQLTTQNHFSPQLLGQKNVMGGVLARGVQKKSDMPLAIDERSEFSKRDTEAALIVNWYPKEKRKGIPALRLYDLDNRLLAESKLKKSISLSPNKFLYTTWQFNIAGMAPGFYRIDVLLDSDAVWRTFFRIVD